MRLIFQLEELGVHLRALPKATEARHELPMEERAALEAETLIKLSLLKELSARKNGQRYRLMEHLTKLVGLLGLVGQCVSDKYFDHKTSSQQLVNRTTGE
ncbi:MAG: hypothetical protein U5M23_04870 [Marinagarivorans sp.]|nr:hypothetical protein [Marinagarivorans sp.]